MKIKSDVLATIYLYHTTHGGKKFPITSEYFGCPVSFEKSTKQGYDCRIYLYDIKIISPGDICANIPIKFLDWDTVKFLIASNKRFYLWEGGFIGEGIVEKISEESQIDDKKVNIEVLRFKLYSLMDSLTKFLELQGENNWRNGFVNVLKEINNNSDLKEIARSVMRNYGGMGSFNDLILHRDNKPLIQENDTLETLSTSMYDTSSSLMMRNNFLKIN